MVPYIQKKSEHVPKHVKDKEQRLNKSSKEFQNVENTGFGSQGSPDQILKQIPTHRKNKYKNPNKKPNNVGTKNDAHI